MTVFGPWGNYSDVLAEKLQKVCQKCNLYVQKIQRELRTFGRFVKTALYLSEWDFWLNYFSMNFLSFVNVFRLWAENSATLAQKLQRSCQKCILLEQQNFSRKDCFLKKLFTFTIFSSFDGKLRRLLPEILPPALKNCFPHSFSGSSCVKLSFSSRKILPTNGLWGKMFEIL